MKTITKALLTCLLIIYSVGLAYSQSPSPNGSLDCLSEFHDLNDEQCPDNWEYRTSGAYFQGGKLWAYPTSHGGNFSKTLSPSPDLKSLELSIDSLVRYSYWGVKAHIIIQMSNGTGFRIWHGVEAYDHGNNNALCIDLLGVQNDAFSMEYTRENGEFNFSVLATEGHLSLMAVRILDGEVVATFEQDVPTLEMQFIEKVTYHLEVQTNNGSWIDNLDFMACYESENSLPIADAGPDQAVLLVDSLITLDGSGSWDEEGDPIDYQWSFISKPSNSQAEIAESTSVNPSFIADVNGDYEISLVVNDQSGSSDPDTVLVSFDNVVPVADAGLSQTVILGETATLDGTASYDANLDPLMFSWAILTRPSGSMCQIDNEYDSVTTIQPDMAGEYTLSLIVNDGIVDSTPDIVSIQVITYDEAAITALIDAIDVINSLPGSVFKNKNMGKVLAKKINTVISLIVEGNYSEALDKLEQDVIAKVNGCEESGEPDQNDWIQECWAQFDVYNELMLAHGHLMLSQGNQHP